MTRSERAADPNRAREAVWEKRQILFDQHGRNPALSHGAHEVRKLVLLLSASRSGSSLLFQLLAGSGDFLTPLGEETPFYRLAKIGDIETPDDSDAVRTGTLREEQKKKLVIGIIGDLGRLSKNGSEFPLQDFALDCAQRLLLQWPELDLDPEEIHESARRNLSEELERGDFDVIRFWMKWLSRLKQEGKDVSPELYDIQRNPGQGRVPLPARFIEEPPFIVPAPRLHASARDLATRTVLLKSPANCYRMPLIRELFPNAQIRVVFLTRNPGASISGLMDGWTSDRFHSRNVAGVSPLRIEGYTSEERPGSREWWKFDLPPGWHRMTQRPLPEVCAFQWMSANRSVLSDPLARGDSFLQIRYENLLEPESLDRELRRILEFAGSDSITAPVNPPPAVMTVNPPRKRKWLERRSLIDAALSDAEVQATARQLGYEIAERMSWP